MGSTFYTLSKTVLCIFVLTLFGCSKEIIHIGRLVTVDSYKITGITSPPWIKLKLTDEKTNDIVTVHLQKHCYNYKSIPIGNKFLVNKVEITYEDYSTKIEMLPSSDETQQIIDKYCS